MEDGDLKVLSDSLRRAMEIERTGHHFYTMAAKSVKDPKGREVFTALAAEELAHEGFLSVHYRSVLENGELAGDAALGARRDLPGPDPVFSEKLKERIGKAHAEMAALAVGIQVELSSIQFYQEQAASAPSDRARRFFEELADWESGHYQALLRQQESLKEDYWSKGGFAPF